MKIKSYIIFESRQGIMMQWCELRCCVNITSLLTSRYFFEVGRASLRDKEVAFPARASPGREDLAEVFLACIQADSIQFNSIH